jgi:hypothetical protein
MPTMPTEPSSSRIQRPGKTRRRALRWSAAAVALLAVSGAAACSSTDPVSGGSGSASSAIAGGEASPGLTATTVKVGFIIVDVGDLQASLGFTTANYGGVEGITRQIQAVVNAVNANNGLGGRQIEPVFRSYEATTDSPEQAEALCNAFTQDDQVFAVVMDGQFQNNARNCYSQRRTLMIDTTLIAQDQNEFERYAPYLWSPVFPEYGAFLRTQLASLRDSGWFTGAQGVAIVAVDTEVARRQVTDTVRPFLAENGVAKSGDFYVDSSNVGSLGVGSAAALTGAAAQGLDRLIVVGGARILPVMLAQTEASSTTAKFAISSYDSPLFLQDNPTSIVGETLNGMIGFGLLPAGDVRDDPTLPFPDPNNQSQGLCKTIIDSAQATPPEGVRPNYKSGLQYCDALLFMKATMDVAPQLVTAASFQEAAWQTGTAYSSSVTFGGNVVPGQYAASTIGRVLAFEPTCQNPTTGAPGCFLYRGENVPFTTG